MIGYKYNTLMGKFLVNENIFANVGAGVGTGFLVLSSDIIYPYTETVNRPSAPDYQDLQCDHSDWVFYLAASTGDRSDAIVSLKTTKEFPIATSSWGNINAIALTDTAAGTGLGIFFFHNFSTPVTVDIGTSIVFLGSTTLGDGDIVIYPYA